MDKSNMVDRKPVIEPGLLEREASMLIESFKNATVTTGEIVQYCAIVKKQRITNLQPAVPKTLSSALGRHIERYDQICDYMNERLLQSIAVLKRDLQRETQRLENQSKTIVKSEPTKPEPSDQDKDGFKVDANGVIHIDSDSEDEVPLAQRGLAKGPSAISLLNLQKSPNKEIIDLTGDSQSLSHAHKKTKAVPLRLDLSSDTLHGMSTFGQTNPPSPVTLAPRTARPSTDPNALPHGMFPSEQTQQDLIPHLLSALAAQSQSQHDMIGNGTQPSTSSEVIDLTLDPNDQMDLDLFGEIVDDEDDDAEGNDDMRTVEKMFAQSGAGGSDHSRSNSTPAQSRLNTVTPGDAVFEALADSQSSQSTALIPSSSSALGSQNTAELLATLSGFSSATSDNIPPITNDSTSNLFNNADPTISTDHMTLPQDQSNGEQLDLSSMGIDFSGLPLNTNDFFNAAEEGGGGIGDVAMPDGVGSGDNAMDIDSIDITAMLNSMGGQPQSS